MSTSAPLRLPVSLSLDSESATVALARAMAPGLGAGDVLALEGEIGAGKSVFARAVIRARLAAMGRDEEVPSPTYTLVQTYLAGDLEIWHADLYRLGGPEEALELGLDHAFETALSLVEWPDRLGPDLPATALRLALCNDDRPDTRRCTLDGPPPWDSRLAGMLQMSGVSLG